MNACELGRVVVSRAGRDKGSAFLIVGREAERLLLADGRLHKVAKPKKKNIMHIFARPELITSIQGKLERGESLEDHEIRKALQEAGYPARGKAEGEGEHWQKAI